MSEDRLNRFQTEESPIRTATALTPNNAVPVSANLDNNRRNQSYQQSLSPVNPSILRSNNTRRVMSQEYRSSSLRSFGLTSSGGDSDNTIRRAATLTHYADGNDSNNIRSISRGDSVQSLGGNTRTSGRISDGRPNAASIVNNMLNRLGEIPNFDPNLLSNTGDRSTCSSKNSSTRSLMREESEDELLREEDDFDDDEFLREEEIEEETLRLAEEAQEEEMVQLAMERSLSEFNTSSHSDDAIEQRRQNNNTNFPVLTSPQRSRSYMSPRTTRPDFVRAQNVQHSSTRSLNEVRRPANQIRNSNLPEGFTRAASERFPSNNNNNTGLDMFDLSPRDDFPRPRVARGRQPPRLSPLEPDPRTQQQPGVFPQSNMRSPRRMRISKRQNPNSPGAVPVSSPPTRSKQRGQRTPHSSIVEQIDGPSLITKTPEVRHAIERFVTGSHDDKLQSEPDAIQSGNDTEETPHQVQPGKQRGYHNPNSLFVEQIDGHSIPKTPEVRNAIERFVTDPGDKKPHSEPEAIPSCNETDETLHQVQPYDQQGSDLHQVQPNDQQGSQLSVSDDDLHISDQYDEEFDEEMLSAAESDVLPASQRSRMETLGLGKEQEDSIAAVLRQNNISGDSNADGSNLTREDILSLVRQNMSPLEVRLIEEALLKGNQQQEQLPTDQEPKDDLTSDVTFSQEQVAWNASKQQTRAWNLNTEGQRARNNGNDATNWPTPGEQLQREAAAAIQSGKKSLGKDMASGEHLSEEELQQIELALRASQEEVPPNANIYKNLASEYDLSGASEYLSEEEFLKIKQALEESESCKSNMQERSIDHHHHLSAEDAAAIAQALRDAGEDEHSISMALRQADEDQQKKSLELALRMQKEEEDYRMHKRQSGSTQCQGNVRTMTRAEYEAQEIASALMKSPHDSYPHRIEDEFDEDEYKVAGFRMNSSAQQEWSRLDRNSIVGPNSEVRTKHDTELHGQANAHRLGLDSDDVGNIGNKAYNSFLQSMKGTTKGVATKGTGRAGSDTDATKGAAMDPSVRSLITRAINSELIEKCNGVVKEGKEAIVYHADKGSESEGFDVAVKVFKRIQEFRGRGDYVEGDPRYGTGAFKNASSRIQLELWAEKEFRNLMRANKAGVPVPSPLMYKENIIFMRFLGVDGWPAPQLRELELRPGSKRWNTLYEQVIEAMTRLTQSGRLVHGDLSEYNIMVVPAHNVENKGAGVGDSADELQAVLIDFGQAVDIKHPSAKSLLERDVERVVSFFRRQGVETMEKEEIVSLLLIDQR